MFSISLLLFAAEGQCVTKEEQVRYPGLVIGTERQGQERIFPRGRGSFHVPKHHSEDRDSTSSMASPPCSMVQTAVLVLSHPYPDFPAFPLML